MDEPTGPADLVPPFTAIGDPGWDAALRTLLADYGCPLPSPTDPANLAAAERRLGCPFPAVVRQFYLALGPVNFDSPTLLDPSAMTPAAELWMWAMLPPRDQAVLRPMITIAEMSDDGYVLDPTTSACARVSHDPPGIETWLPSFDAFIQCACIELSWSGYGWPNPAIEQWSAQLLRERYGIPWL